jgi:SagB-type dehydrogenase family enzyme
MKVNPELFFKFHDGKFIAWNYRAHEQFELTLPYLQRLYEIAAGDRSAQSNEQPRVAPATVDIDAELHAAALVAPAFPDVEWGWDSLSHIFHIGTSTQLPPAADLPREDSSASYIEQCEALGHVTPDVIAAVTGDVYRLPAPEVEQLRQISLWDALLARRTAREFTREPISLETVATILYATFGAVHGPDRSDVEGFGIRSYGYRRTSPSGGSLQVTEPYLINLTIAGLPQGIYHYHAIDHTLTRIASEFRATDLGPLLVGQNFANDLGFAIFLTVRFDKMWWKYPHSRSYRIALLDVGHLSQTFHVACTAFQLSSWLTGAFYDEEVARCLALDPNRHGVILLIGAGTGHGRAINQAILDALSPARELSG